MRPALHSAAQLVVGCLRVSTAEQGQSGLGLEAQQASVRAYVEAQGWALVAEYSDIASGKDDRRPGFQAALARCQQLGAVLAAAHLDRITRRTRNLSSLLEDSYDWPVAPVRGSGSEPSMIVGVFSGLEGEASAVTLSRPAMYSQPWPRCAREKIMDGWFKYVKGQMPDLYSGVYHVVRVNTM